MRRANEGFSRKRGVCRHCSKLGSAEIAFGQHARDIDRLLTFDGLVRRTHQSAFEKYLVHADSRVRAYAVRVKQRDEVRRQELRAMWAEIQAEEAAYEESMLEVDAEADVCEGDQEPTGRDEDDEIPF